MKKNKKKKIRRDDKGEYVLQTYFVGGKMKHEKVYLIEGLSAEEFYRKNADPVTLMQNGDYDLLDEYLF